MSFQMFRWVLKDLKCTFKPRLHVGDTHCRKGPQGKDQEEAEERGHDGGA